MMYTLVVEKNRLKVTARSLCKRIKWNMSFYAPGFSFRKNITEITSSPCHLFPSSGSGGAEKSKCTNSHIQLSRFDKRENTSHPLRVQWRVYSTPGNVDGKRERERKLERGRVVVSRGCQYFNDTKFDTVLTLGTCVVSLRGVRPFFFLINI